MTANTSEQIMNVLAVMPVPDCSSHSSNDEPFNAWRATLSSWPEASVRRSDASPATGTGPPTPVASLSRFSIALSAADPDRRETRRKMPMRLAVDDDEDERDDHPELHYRTSRMPSNMSGGEQNARRAKPLAHLRTHAGREKRPTTLPSGPRPVFSKR